MSNQLSKNNQNYNSFLPPLWIITLIAVYVLFLIANQLKEILVLLVVGYSLAFCIDPILDILEKRKISRSIGVVLIIITFIGFLLLAIFSAVPVLIEDYVRLAGNFPDYLKLFQERISGFLTSLQSHLPLSMRNHFSIKSLPEWGNKMLTGGYGEKVFIIAKDALLTGYSFTLTIINLLLLPFIVYYLSVDLDRYHIAIYNLIPKSHRKTVKGLANEMHEYTLAFLKGQLLLGCIMTFLYLIGLGFVAKVELWVLLAVISGFGNIVPYLGTIVGITLSSIMALVTHEQFSALLWVWGVYAVVQFLEGMFITPKVLGEKVGLSPLTVILSIVAFGKLFGLLGIFLAIPMAAIVKVLGKHFHGWVLNKVA